LVLPRVHSLFRVRIGLEHLQVRSHGRAFCSIQFEVAEGVFPSVPDFEFADVILGSLVEAAVDLVGGPVGEMRQVHFFDSDRALLLQALEGGLVRLRFFQEGPSFGLREQAEAWDRVECQRDLVLSGREILKGAVEAAQSLLGALAVRGGRDVEGSRNYQVLIAATEQGARALAAL